MKIRLPNKFTFIFIVLVLSNLAIFLKVNLIPIRWLQDELPCYRFYWSMDNLKQLTLHSGLTAQDFLKPFVGRYTDGAFRPRQVSSFFEMFSFKFWQSLGVGYFRDYSLILLHLLNVFLLWQLIRGITGKNESAWLAALLMLNSGIALSTLLFPFRPPKILVVTFFLLNWNLIVYTPGPFHQAKTQRLFLFSALLILAFLTDESFVFLFPIYFLYLAIRDGRETLMNQRLCRYLAGTFLILFMLLTTFYIFSESIMKSQAWYGSYFGNLLQSLVRLQTFKDIGKAFFAYFLRRNFGHWGFSFWGALALCAFLGIAWAAWRSPKVKNNSILAAGLLAIIFMKTLFLPHMNFHAHIMPEGTVFPSMLFFSYYYPYTDSLIVICALILTLNTALTSIKKFIIFLCLVSVINISNMVYAKQGIQDALQFHELNMTLRKQIVQDVLALKNILRSHKQEPIYLSFPTGDKALLDGRFGFDAYWPVYASYIVTMFLPPIEKGDIITSLENIKSTKSLAADEEMNEAKWFYDVAHQHLINLQDIRKQLNIPVIKPRHIIEKAWIEFPPLKILENEESIIPSIIFFIKGYADYRLGLNEEKIEGKQLYGQSYQIIKCKVKKLKPTETILVTLRIKPSEGQNNAAVIGPFLLRE